MCRPVTCRTCKKTTWAGCGQHVEMVKMSVPRSEWCNGQHTQAQLDEAAAAKAADGSGFLSGLLSRITGRDTGK